MPPTEMEDGLEVNIDDFFGEVSTSVPSLGDGEGEGFSWADDFISSATGVFADKPAVTTTTELSPNILPQDGSTLSNMAAASSSGATVVQQKLVAQQQHQQQFSMVSVQQSQVHKAPVTNIQGSVFGHAKYRKKGSHSVPQFVIKTTNTGQIQQQQQQQSSPAPVTYSANSPLISRSVTPSCSPAPSISPLVSRSLTPQSIPAPNTARPPSHSSSPAPNVNMLQFNQSRQQTVQLTNTVPIQGLIQNPSPNPNSIIPGQPTLTPNIVHTQNAVIQNPNVVNLNVAHVLCNNSQAMSQPGVQTVPVTMQNPMNIQGTIIQTAQGKSILIPNTHLQGQQLNLQGQQVNFAGMQMAQPNTVGQTMVQNTQNLSNVIRLAPQQDNKQNVAAQPNYSFLSLPGQGQQILIQRPTNPGQPQNIILRSVAPNIILQPQGQGNQNQPIQPHQVVHQQATPNLQFQQVLAGGQTMKIVGTGGTQVGPQSGAVTLNLAGQNLNLQQIAGLGSGNLQFGNGGQFILQQPQQQQQQQQLTSKTTFSTAVSKTIAGQSTTVSSSSAAVDPLTQALSLSGITENGAQFTTPSPVPTPPPEAPAKKKGSRNRKSETDRSGTPHTTAATFPMATSSTNQQLPVSQLMATAASAAGIDGNSGMLGMNTVFSTAQGTVVTTTISQSFVPTPSTLSIVTSSLGGQVVNSVANPTTTSTLIQGQVKGQGQVIGQNQIIVQGQSQVTGQVISQGQSQVLTQGQVVNQVQGQSQLLGQGQGQQIVTVNQSSSNVSVQQASDSTSKHIERIDGEIKKLLSLKSLTAEQKREIQQLSMLQKRLMASNQNQATKNAANQQPAGGVHIIGQPGISQQMAAPVLQLPTPSSNPIKHIQPIQNIQSSSSATVIQSSPSPSLASSKGASRNIAIQPGTLVSSSSSIPPGKLPIPPLSAVPTQIRIGSQILTLNLTAQQKEKLQTHLSKMTMEQQEQFLKHQPTLKLQQKQQKIQELQKQQQAVQQAQQTLPSLITAKARTETTVGQSTTTDTGQPSLQPRVNKVTPEIPKASLIHQQMSKDQQNAIAPDTKTPFKNSREACRRLLRYHVFQWAGPSKEEYDRADYMLEQRSVELLNKSRTMMDKYRHLLLKDSMRKSPSAEMVMIHRMLQQDLTACLKEDKRRVEEDPESFKPMPLKYLKKEEAASADQSFEENKIVKKESSFEEESSSARETSAEDDSDQSVAMPIDKVGRRVFKSSPSSGTMKLLIRKHSQGFVSSLAHDSPPITSRSPSVSVKKERVDPSYDIVPPMKYSDTKSSVKCDSLSESSSYKVFSSSGQSESFSSKVFSSSNQSETSKVFLSTNQSESSSKIYSRTNQSESSHKVFSSSSQSESSSKVFSSSNGQSFPARIKIKSENSVRTAKSPLHIHIGSNMEIPDDPSYQHSDESYEDYKDSVLISRDMSNMSHTDVSDASVTEDYHGDFDDSVSPVGRAFSHQSKSINDLALNIGESLTESICSERSGRERGDIVDSVESESFCTASPVSSYTVKYPGVEEEEGGGV